MKLNSFQPTEIKIQISPTRRIEDLINIWHTAGEGIDLVMDPRYGLKFRPGSVKVIYAFDIIGNTEPAKVEEMLRSFYQALQPNGELYIVETDFDYVTRAAVGGDISPEDFSRDFSRKTYVTLQYLAKMLNKIGMPQEKQVVWYQTEGLKFTKHHYEAVVLGRKGNE